MAWNCELLKLIDLIHDVEMKSRKQEETKHLKKSHLIKSVLIPGTFSFLHTLCHFRCQMYA